MWRMFAEKETNKMSEESNASEQIIKVSAHLCSLYKLLYGYALKHTFGV